MRQTFWFKTSKFLERFQLSEPRPLPISFTSQKIECSSSSDESLITCSENFLNNDQWINASYVGENSFRVDGSDNICSVISTASDLKDVEYSYDYNNELPISEDESLEEKSIIQKESPILLFNDEILALIDSMILVLADSNRCITELSNIRIEEKELMNPKLTT